MNSKYKSALSIAGGEERFVCPEALVLNPYMGCSFNCVYCYAKWMLSIFNKWQPIVPADTKVVAAQFEKAYSGKGRDKVSRLLRQRIPVRVGSLTDPFQPAEKTYDVTRILLNILKRYDHPAIINTKGTICTDSEYIKQLDHIPSVVQMSFSTDDNALAKKLEPGAPPPSERFEALQYLSDKGINTQIRYSPAFPLISDNPEVLFEQAAKAGTDGVICEFGRIANRKDALSGFNEALGYDYIEYLLREGYPIVKQGSFWKVDPDLIFDEYRRFKSIAHDHGLQFWVCSEEQPEINNWTNCCGVEQYSGFENSMDWTIQMRGKLIGRNGITCNDYLEGTSCPYKPEFRRAWDKGQLGSSLTDLNIRIGSNENVIYYRKDN